MSEETKFTDDEMGTVKEIQETYYNIQNDLGQLSIAKLRLEKQLDNINVENDKAFTFTFADVETRADELDTADNSKEDLKASAKAKLIAGEKLTEEEANTLVGV